MIAHGLSEDDALAALTTDAADLLGLSRRLGTVEEGKIANLVVTNRPLFAEDTEIRYVFVDGRPFEYDTTPSPGGNAEAGDVAAAGTWELGISTPGGDQTTTLVLEGTPGDLSGTITGPDGEEQPADDLELDGATLTFSFDGGDIGTIDVSATLDGDEMDGSVTVPGFGSLPLEGTRVSGPER